jgi:aryl-alcohol dehydrogenase-like predicted oxidoreductase
MLVSVLGLGTVKLGRNEGVKYPRPFDLPTDADALVLLDTAAELGINLLDTAPAYGSAEQRLGDLLAGRRDRWILSTKVGEEFENGRSRFDFSAAHTTESVDRSLARLGTDHLDIVLVHSDGDDLAAMDQGVMETLGRCKQAGKVRAIGFSPKSVDGARAAMPLSDVLMLALNPTEPEMLPVVREAHARGVGVLIKKGLRSGHLPAGGADPVEDALRYLLAEPGVSSVVVGTINAAHLQHNAGAAERAR